MTDLENVIDDTMDLFNKCQKEGWVMKAACEYKQYLDDAMTFYHTNDIDAYNVISAANDKLKQLYNIEHIKYNKVD